MLLDMQRLAARSTAASRRDPERSRCSLRIEHALASYVRGRLLVSLIIGASAGVGICLLGVTGLLPDGENYALLFGAWVALTELIPYLGPVARRDPAVRLRARRAPDSRRLGGAALPRHPPDRGPRRRAERDGQRAAAAPAARHLRAARRRRDLRPAGRAVALPLLAAGRATGSSSRERLVFESWPADGGGPGRGRAGEQPTEPTRRRGRATPPVLTASSAVPASAR